MELDPVSLAALAAPFLAKDAEAFTKTAGEKLGEKIVELCQAVMDKFKGDSYAEQTLARAKEKPESEARQGVFKEVLAEKMEADSDFAEKLQKLVDEVQKASTRTLFDQRGQMVQGSQNNINESIGSVFSGTFSGSATIGNTKSRNSK
jgi:hypothetical protein